RARSGCRRHGRFAWSRSRCRRRRSDGVVARRCGCGGGRRSGALRAESCMTINDYALIGDGRSAALVSRNGAIDWLCWPRFDSPPIFGALLDPHGGSWRIAPVGAARMSRRYLGDTNVLETRFETAQGTLVVVDLMTVTDEKAKGLMPDHELLRHVRCER